MLSAMDSPLALGEEIPQGWWLKAHEPALAGSILLSSDYIRLDNGGEKIM